MVVLLFSNLFLPWLWKGGLAISSHLYARTLYLQGICSFTPAPRLTLRRRHPLFHNPVAPPSSHFLRFLSPSFLSSDAHPSPRGLDSPNVVARRSDFYATTVTIVLSSPVIIQPKRSPSLKVPQFDTIWRWHHFTTFEEVVRSTVTDSSEETNS